LPQSASCSENFVIPPDVFGQTLRVRTVKKLTTGPRGVLFLSEREFYRLRFESAGAYGTLLSLGMRAVQRLSARRLHEASDRSFPHHRVVDASESGHDIYIGIAVLAVREDKRRG